MLLYDKTHYIGKVEERILDSLLFYAQRRVKPGHFLTAVLCNNLVEAINRADEESLKALPHIVRFCKNQLPQCCWGSPQAFAEWVSTEGEGIIL